jgi:hypothetical protein
VETISLYILPSAFGVFVYLSFFGWLALRIGLRTRVRTKAIVMALGVTLCWVGGPAVAGAILGRELGLLAPEAQAVLQAASPACAVAGLEKGRPFGQFLAICNVAIYAMALGVLRTLCLRQADGHLGRAEPSDPDADEPPEEEDA